MSTTSDSLSVSRSRGRDRGVINWDVEGRTDLVFGTGAHRTEKWLGYTAALLLTGLILAVELTTGARSLVDWRTVLIAFLAFDVAGGAVANMLNSCKRFYHAPHSGNHGLALRFVRRPMLFTAAHVHPIVVALAFGAPLSIGIVWYLTLLASVFVTLKMPLYLRRATATALTVLAIIIEGAILSLDVGLAWFIPCLFIKLAIGHAVQEEPYRPS